MQKKSETRTLYSDAIWIIALEVGTAEKNESKDANGYILTLFETMFFFKLEPLRIFLNSRMLNSAVWRNWNVFTK